MSRSHRFKPLVPDYRPIPDELLLEMSESRLDAFFDEVVKRVMENESGEPDEGSMIPVVEGA